MQATADRTAAVTERETHPRWVRWVTHAAVLPPIGSGIWRIAMGFHLPVGWRGPIPWYGAPYTVVLSAVAETLALLALGFIKPWGVVFPSRLPVIGGRRVHPAAAILPASLASILLTVLGVEGVARWSTVASEPESPRGFAFDVMTAAYAPLVLWGPLLAAATFGYVLRVRRLRAPCTGTASSC